MDLDNEGLITFIVNLLDKASKCDRCKMKFDEFLNELTRHSRATSGVSL